MINMQLIGRATKDATAKNIVSNGKEYKVTEFDIACDKRPGVRNEKNTEFIRVTAWSKLGETCLTYVKKGMLLYCSGNGEMSMWTGNNGITYGRIDLTADNVEFLSRPAQEQPKNEEKPPVAVPPAEPINDENELPF